MQLKVDGCHPNRATQAHNTAANITNLKEQVVCSELTNKDYVDLIWITFAEILGVLIAWLFIERMGRRWSLVLMYGVGGLSLLLLTTCTTRRASMVFVFVARSSILGAYFANYIYTAEVLPTNVRAVGIGVCSSMARIGAMVTPFVAQVLISQSFYYAVIVYASPMLLCMLVVLLIKVETTGKLLVDSSRADMFGFGSTDTKDYQSFSR